MSSSKGRIRGLVLLNLVLVTALVFVSRGPIAHGNSGAGSNTAGDYMMVGGSINGATSNAVYMLDQRSGILLTMLYDRSQKKLDLLGWRSVADDERRAEPSR